MGILIGFSFTIAFVIFLIICFAGFNRYLFHKHLGIFSYLLIFVYSSTIPITHSVFTVGAMDVIYKAFNGSVPIPWLSNAFCFFGSILLASSPTFLTGKTKGLDIWMLILPFILGAAGIFTLKTDPWWNVVLKETIDPSFPSIGVLMIVANIFFFLSHLVALYLTRGNKLIEGGTD